MKQCKRTIAVLLCLVLLLSTATFGVSALAAGQTEDPPTQAMENCLQLGLLSGFPDGSLRPENPVTRAQLCKMVWLAWSGSQAPVAGVPTAFLDGNGHWAQSFIAACHRQGFVAGTGAGYFSPNTTVTLLEGAKMMLTALGYDPAWEGLTGPDWADNTAALAKQTGLLKGVDTRSALTRADAAQLLWNGLHASQVTYTLQTIPSEQGTPTKQWVRQEEPSLWEAKFSLQAPEAGKAALRAIAQLLGEEKMAEILSGQTPDGLDDLQTDQLDALVTALAALPTEDKEEADTINGLMDQIHEILSFRLPWETTPVTPALLLQFVEDKIITCQELLDQPVLDPDTLDKDAATMTLEEIQQAARALLEKLRPFYATIQGSLTKDNAYKYWCLYWDTILAQPMPASYVPG